MSLPAALALAGRVLLYTVLFILVLVVSEVAGELTARAPDPLPALATATAAVGGAFAITRLMRRRIDKRPWEGMALPRPQWGRLAAGLAFGAGVMLLVCAVQYALGWLRPAGTEMAESGAAAALGALVGGLILMLGVGFSEELALRGYVFQTLGERTPIWLAVLLSGLLFGVGHAGNGGFGWGFVISALVITVTFVAFRLVTGSLWFPIGYHAAWNWVQYSVIGVSNVNDRAEDDALIHVDQYGPQLWTGEAPSIEGGLLILIVDVLIAAALILQARRRGIGLGDRMSEHGQVAARP